MSRAASLVGAAVALALTAWLAMGCSPKSLWQMGLGTGGSSLQVVEVTERAGYLDVRLSGHGIQMRTFTAASEVCLRVLARGNDVGYLERGIGGSFQQDEERCPAVGIGDPRLARARQPRGTSPATIPRAQATFELIHQDEEVLMLRGRFPLAGRVGWAGGVDSVAVVRNEARCRAATGRGVTSMEFRPTGRNTLALLAPDGLCRIDGLLLPL